MKERFASQAYLFLKKSLHPITSLKHKDFCCFFDFVVFVVLDITFLAGERIPFQSQHSISYRSLLTWSFLALTCFGYYEASLWSHNSINPESQKQTRCTCLCFPFLRSLFVRPFKGQSLSEQLSESEKKENRSSSEVKKFHSLIKSSLIRHYELVRKSFCW